MSSLDRFKSSGAVITTVLCVFTIIQFFLQGSLSVMAHEIKRDFDIDAASMSLLSSAFFYSYILLQVPVGLILDRFGMHKTCFFALMIMGVSCFAFSLAPSFSSALFVRVVMGAGASFGFVAMLRSIKVYFPVGQFIFVMSLAEAFSMVGVAGLNVFFSYITDAINWRTSIAVSGVFSILLGFLWFFLKVKEDLPEKGEGAEPLKKPTGVFQSLLKVISYRVVWMNGFFAAFLYSIMTVFVALWGIPYTEKLYKISTTEAASIVSSVYVGLGLASLFLSFLISVFNMKLVLRLGSFASFIFLGWYIYFPPALGFAPYLVLFLAGASLSVYQLAFGIVAENVSKESQSTAGGVTNMLCMSGAPFLQPLLGLALTLSQGGIMDGYESYTVSEYRSAFLILMLCIVFAFFISWFVLPSKRKSTEA